MNVDTARMRWVAAAQLRRCRRVRERLAEYQLRMAAAQATLANVNARRESLRAARLRRSWAAPPPREAPPRVSRPS